MVLLLIIAAIIGMTSAGKENGHGVGNGQDEGFVPPGQGGVPQGQDDDQVPPGQDPGFAPPGQSIDWIPEV
jgi:hypothetical protein